MWENATIGRKLSSNGALAVVEELVRSGHAEWHDTSKSMVTLMWHSTEEIAAKLFDFARKHDMVGNVFTVYELHRGDEVLGTVSRYPRSYAMERVDPTMSWILVSEALYWYLCIHGFRF